VTRVGPLLWWGNHWVWYARAAFMLALAVAFGVTTSWLIAPFFLVFAGGYTVIARSKQQRAEREG
jgi:hypothetical protein